MDSALIGAAAHRSSESWQAQCAPWDSLEVPHTVLEASMPVTDLIELNVLMARVKQAQALYAQFTQAQVDVIFRSAAVPRWPLPTPASRWPGWR